MIFKEITVELKRTVRHQPYVISDPKIALTASFEKDEDEEVAIENLCADVRYFLDRMEARERVWHKRQRGNVKQVT